MSLSFLIILLFVVVCWTSFGKLSKHAAGGGALARATRLKRIETASWWIQLLLVISFLVMAYSALAFFMGWPFFSEPQSRIVISHNHIYTAPGEMPGDILGLFLVKVVLMFGSYGVLFSLFGLYRQGQLFTARTVYRIRLLGYFLIVNWALDFQMQSSLHDMDMNTTPVFIGLLIIFVSWIMDEGRKIQEEQELTV